MKKINILLILDLNPDIKMFEKLEDSIDGTRVYMDWHDYLGSIFFKDNNCTREIVDWYDNPLICDALDWFQKRGNKA